MEVNSLLKRLGISDTKVAAKACEYLRVATARLGAGGLGQGELCKGAACVELACMTLGVALDAALVARYSGVGDKVYRNAKAALQKVLGVTSRATARDLCIQFGCARHDQSVKAALAAYKERFVRSLPAVQQGHVDFGRPVFLGAAFYLVARKNKVAVDRMKLLGPLGVTATEFAQVCASMADLCDDLVGTQATRKRKAEELEGAGAEEGALIQRTGAVDDGDVASDSEDEVVDDTQVGYRVNAKKQQQREYEEWKQKMGQEKKKEGKQEKLTEKKLRQAVLSFAAAAPPAAAAADAAVSPPAAAAADAAAGPPAAESAQPSNSAAAAKRAKGSTECAKAGEQQAAAGGGSKAGKTPAKKAAAKKALASKNN